MHGDYHQIVMWKKILVPVDGSSCAEQALHVALDIAERWGAELTVCVVADDDEIVVGAMPTDARELLTDACAQIRERGVQCLCEVIFEAKPGVAIAQTAQKNQSDVVIIGTHGRSGFARTMMGSVAESVLRHAACEVVIVRPKRDVPREAGAAQEPTPLPS